MIRQLVAALLLVGAGACSLIGPQQVVVSAAASLTEAFAELEAAYEAEHPDTDIVLNVAGSQVLAGQIVAGAPADVFAAADHVAVRTVTDAGLGVADPLTFATNSLVIVVPEGNPDGVNGLADLPALDVVLGAPEVPIGSYTAEVLATAGVHVDPVSLEPNTRAAVARVANGDADAAIGYRTDVAAVDGVAGVAIPAAVQPSIVYQILLLDDAGAGFIEFVASVEARQILRRYGFSSP